MSTQGRLDETLARITEKVDTIAYFVGQSAEIQAATQQKMDQHFERSAEIQTATQHKIDQYIKRSEELQTATQEKLDTIARFIGQATEIQMATQHKLDNLIQHSETVSKNIEDLTVAIREQQSTINGYQEIAREQARTTAELIKLVT